MSTAKKILLSISVIGTVALMLFVAQLSNRTDMALLYAGLEGRASGEVITKLEQMGVPSEIRGTAVYVNRADRDRVRMLLAAGGLPANGQQGYELLDGLSGFGTTAEMFDAAYWRAKEGELARTLLATPGISQARVHIGTPRRRSFSNTRAEPTASVTLAGDSGPITRGTGMAARYLVSLAVPGLAAGQVAVIDSNNGVLLRPGDDGGGAGSAADTELAGKMKSEISAMLAARVGEGRARVSVNIETTRESETISRRIIDPESKSLRETKTSEVAASGNDSGNAVTVASNLPDGDAKGGERSSTRDENRRTDVFDYTETVEEVLRPAGTIKRISVAVLLDEIRGADGTAASEPRSREEMEKLESLVKSAIGFDEERGDLVSVESISFAEIPVEGTTATPESLPSFVEANMMQLIQTAVLSLVAVILGLFVVRPILLAERNQGVPALSEEDAALGAIDITPPSAAPGNAGFAAQSATDPGMPGVAGRAAPPNAIELLRDAVDSRGEESADVIRSWLESDNDLERTG